MRTQAFVFGNNLNTSTVTVHAVTLRHAMHLAAKALNVSVVNVVCLRMFDTGMVA
jgi:hypothetical protein